MSAVPESRMEQACREFPALRELFRDAGSTGAEAASVAVAVVLAAPLVPAVRKAFGIKAWTVGAVLRSECLSGFGPTALSRLLVLIDAVAPEKAPKTREEWLAAVVFEQFLRVVPAGKSASRAWFREASTTGWTKFADRHFGDGGAAVPVLMYSHALWAAARAAMPAGRLSPPQEAGMRRALGEAVGTVTYRRLHAAAARWHAESASGRGTAGFRWEPLLLPNRFEAGGGRTVECLTDGRSLADEGLAMRHCAAGLAAECALGRTHVVSVRSGGERESTAELRIARENGRARVWIVQHRGPGNAEPGDGAAEALRGYCGAAEAEGNARRLAALADRAETGAPPLSDPHFPGGLGREEFEESVRRKAAEEVAAWDAGLRGEMGRDESVREWAARRVLALETGERGIRDENQ